MFLPLGNLLRKLKTFTTRRTSSRDPRRRRAPRLVLEPLDERTVLSPVVSLQYNNVAATPAITTAFVDDLYLDVLYRAPTATELSSMSSALNNHTLTGGAAFGQLINSPEYQNFVSPILTMYEVYL